LLSSGAIERFLDRFDSGGTVAEEVSEADTASLGPG
jgi:hypothetical protein